MKVKHLKDKTTIELTASNSCKIGLNQPRQLRMDVRYH
jgi:hypothetical protein